MTSGGSYLTEVLAPDHAEPVASTDVSYHELRMMVDRMERVVFCYDPEGMGELYGVRSSGERVSEHLEGLYEGREDEEEWTLSVYDRLYRWEDDSGSTVQIVKEFDEAQFIGDNIPSRARPGTAYVACEMYGQDATEIADHLE